MTLSSDFNILVYSSRISIMKPVTLSLYVIYITTIHAAPSVPVETHNILHPGGIGGIFFKGPNSETIIKGPDGSVITSLAEGGEVHTNTDVEPLAVAPIVVEEETILEEVAPVFVEESAPAFVQETAPVLTEHAPVVVKHEDTQKSDLIGPSGRISTHGSSSVVSGPSSTTVTGRDPVSGETKTVEKIHQPESSLSVIPLTTATVRHSALEPQNPPPVTLHPVSPSTVEVQSLQGKHFSPAYADVHSDDVDSVHSTTVSPLQIVPLTNAYPYRDQGTISELKYKFENSAQTALFNPNNQQQINELGPLGNNVVNKFIPEHVTTVPLYAKSEVSFDNNQPRLYHNINEAHLAATPNIQYQHQIHDSGHLGKSVENTFIPQHITAAPTYVEGQVTIDHNQPRLYHNLNEVNLAATPNIQYQHQTHESEYAGKSVEHTLLPDHVTAPLTYVEGQATIIDYNQPRIHHNIDEVHLTAALNINKEAEHLEKIVDNKLISQFVTASPTHIDSKLGEAAFHRQPRLHNNLNEVHLDAHQNYQQFQLIPEGIARANVENKVVEISSKVDATLNGNYHSSQELYPKLDPHRQPLLTAALLEKGIDISKVRLAPVSLSDVEYANEPIYPQPGWERYSRNVKEGENMEDIN